MRRKGECVGASKKPAQGKGALHHPFFITDTLYVKPLLLLISASKGISYSTTCTMRSFSTILIVGLLDAAVAFQQSPLIQHNQILASKNDGVKLFFSKDDSIEEDGRSTKRREFFKGILGSGMAVIAGEFMSVESASAETGLLPDGVGGFKKPKGLGGLPNKIRNVGDIMVGVLDRHVNLKIVILHILKMEHETHLCRFFVYLPFPTHFCDRMNCKEI